MKRRKKRDKIFSGRIEKVTCYKIVECSRSSVKRVILLHIFIHRESKADLKFLLNISYFL